MNAVAVRGLTKHFKAHHAVADVDFDVPAGGSLGIVGESGSGKTTIARMLVGLERPTAGTITVTGRDRSTPARSAKERGRRARELQIVFQDPYTSLDPSQCARAAIEEVLRHHGRALTLTRPARSRSRPRLDGGRLNAHPAGVRVTVTSAPAGTLTSAVPYQPSRGWRRSIRACTAPVTVTDAPEA